MRDESQGRNSSRREFIAVSAGALAGGAIISQIQVRAAPESPAASPTVPSPVQWASAPPLPWHYGPVDVNLVRRRGYENYFKFSCSFAAAEALLSTLRENHPSSPWGTIPAEMFRFGAGGGLGWGTMCGAINASLAVLNLASSRFEDLGNELVGWYTTFPFPSSLHDTYAKYKNQPTTISNSPLCHVSVSRWADAAGARIHEKEKKDRCAKLTGDTAAKAAELLNSALGDRLQLIYEPRREFSHCLNCHQGPKSLLDDQQGKANCVMCHAEHPTK